MGSFTRDDNTYSSKTLIGQWTEKRKVEQDRIEDFLERCKRENLAIQKMTRLYQSIMQDTPVKMSTDGCVRYGENYGLIFSPSDQNIVQLGWENERPQTMLAAGCQSCLNTVELNIKDGNEVVATVCIQPVARSVFQIISPKCGMTDCVVKYGDTVQFSLANKNISEERLYLASDIVSPLSASSMSGHQKLYLTTNCCSFLTHWKIVCKEPSMRLETEGCPVKSDKFVVIKHAHTNEAIAVEEKYPYNSYFGREYEASCHTYLDGHKCERDLNHISIATIIPPRND